MRKRVAPRASSCGAPAHQCTNRPLTRLKGRIQLLDPEPVEQSLVLPPPLADPHLEVEEDSRAELALQLRAGGRADLLDLAAARADQDRLLRLGLRPDVRPDLDHAALTVGDLSHLNLDRVRQLVARAPQHL